MSLPSEPPSFLTRSTGRSFALFALVSEAIARATGPCWAATSPSLREVVDGDEEIDELVAPRRRIGLGTVRGTALVAHPVTGGTW